jgi:5-deoxy-glucuronate isomerase
MASSLLVRPAATSDAAGCVVAVTPESAGWTYVGFAVHRLATGATLTAGEPGRETCVMILTGVADVVAGDLIAPGLGGRGSVFDALPPGVVYAPAGIPATITAATDCEVAICTAPGSGAGAPRVIAAAQMPIEERGAGTNSRRVRNVLPETEPADSLLITEVYTPGGHWSSYPPHRHDASEGATMTLLEETYYHRTSPEGGFAFQRVYTDDRTLDEAIAVEDGDVVLVPRGYHPVGAAHGYDLYYLNVMAGPERRWAFRNDPAHAWIVAPT